MHRNKLKLFFLMPVILAVSCIKIYDPVISSADEKKYVVSGQITDLDSLQVVNVSVTSEISDPGYIPVTGCTVKILDDRGNVFDLADRENGDYAVWIDPVYILPGISYKVEVTMPDGEQISSDYDTLSECPPVDSVYFIRKDLEGSEPGVYTLGIQFYIDLNAQQYSSRYYRWEAYETWEYHADYPLEWYYDGTIHHVSPPDYSRKVCWITKKVPSIFTLTTNNLAENRYRLLPLHYVNNRSSRLMYGYSLLIKQYSVSEKAYIYWDQLRINSVQTGGLYEKQPLAISGNMHNLTHPDQKVLGFFGAASINAKRIFVQNVPDLPLDFSTICNPTVMRKGLAEVTPRDYPAYLMGDEHGYRLIWLNEECVNCLRLGGTNIKPGFWPN